MKPVCRTPLLRGALIFWGAISLALCSCGAPRTLDLPLADPATTKTEGLSWCARWGLDAFLELNVLWGSDSGYVVLFARDGQVVHAKTAGYADVESGRPMKLDTRFRMASMTKPVTAAAALLLWEEGRLGLDDPVERYIPRAGELRVAASREFGENGNLPTHPLSHPLTVRDLLTFTAGIGHEEESSDLGSLWAERDIYSGKGSLEKRVDRVLTAPLYEQPGERWRYGWSADVLARVVEVAANEPFDEFLERRIFSPLGMDATGFLPPESDRSDLATVYTEGSEGSLIPVAVPGSDALDWTPGGSGLVSTAGDFMRFALMLWNQGSYDGQRILSPQSVATMTRPHVRSGVLADRGLEGLGWGFGLAVVVDSDASLTVDRDGDFWWSGYYGTTFFVSPETNLVGVVLSQNQPGPHSGWPIAIYLAQTFAFWGL